jgi:plastocyanin
VKRHRGLGALLALAISLALTSTASAAPQQLTYRYGPIDMGPFEVDQNTVVGGVPKPSVDGYITHMEADLVDAAGRPIAPTQVMLHHIVFLNLGEPGKFDHHDWTCGIFTGLNGVKVPALADRFYASGEERNVLDLPDGYGYPVKGDDNWVLLWMLMNHHPFSHKIYIQYKITYETERPLSPAYMVWLDVRNCLADPVFDVPGGGAAGSTFSQATTWTAPTPGRIVAGGGHLHGGGKTITLSEPDCGDRELFTSRPLYGPPTAAVYQVRPVLHEPGPLNMSGFLSQQGIPIARGQQLRINAIYDDRFLHTRVMGIFGVYFAPDPSVTEGCGVLPPIEVRASTAPGRRDPPYFRVPLARRPRGRVHRLRGKHPTIRVSDFGFRPERVSVRRGTTLRWRFEDFVAHDVTVASGPRGFSSPNTTSGGVFRVKLTVPGTYRIYCTLHPTAMTQEVRVTRR